MRGAITGSFNRRPAGNAGVATKEAWTLATTKVCTHLELIHNPRPKTGGCEECLKLGDTWVHLRLCEICGHVGCCDSSRNKHATRHYRATDHPIVKSLEPGESWMYCYIDDVMFEVD